MPYGRGFKYAIGARLTFFYGKRVGERSGIYTLSVVPLGPTRRIRRLT